MNMMQLKYVPAHKHSFIIGNHSKSTLRELHKTTCNILLSRRFQNILSEVRTLYTKIVPSNFKKNIMAQKSLIFKCNQKLHWLTSGILNPS